MEDYYDYSGIWIIGLFFKLFSLDYLFALVLVFSFFSDLLISFSLFLDLSFKIT